MSKLLRVLMLLWVPLALAAGCDKRAPQGVPPPAPDSAASPVAGVRPAEVERPAASDRPGAVADGAIEAGQARGGAARGGAPEPTGGAEVPASAPVPKP